MTLPTFIVLGAGKSGTTSLRSYLKQHPEVFMAPRGEPSFFAHEGQTTPFTGPGDDAWSFVTDFNAYARLFEGAEGYRAVGEVSPRYLYYAQAAARMRHYVPEARLVAVLRHPVDRAYSHFLMNRSRQCEPVADFQLALAKEAERLRAGWSWDWSYVGAGLYYEQLRRYYDLFPREQIKVMPYDLLRGDPPAFFRTLFAFLGVDPNFEPDTSTQHRSAATPRSRLVHTMLRGPTSLKRVAKRVLPGDVRQRVKTTIRTWNAVRPDPVPPPLRQALFDRYFADDCRRLAALIDHDLTHWATTERHAAST